jgi:hypothetical protein
MIPKGTLGLTCNDLTFQKQLYKTTNTVKAPEDMELYIFASIIFN